MLSQNTKKSPFEIRLLQKEFFDWFCSGPASAKQIFLNEFVKESPSVLLQSLSTVLEPVLHRDYEVLATEEFTNCLIKSFHLNFYPALKHSKNDHFIKVKASNNVPESIDLDTCNAVAISRRNNRLFSKKDLYKQDFENNFFKTKEFLQKFISWNNFEAGEFLMLLVSYCKIPDLIYLANVIQKQLMKKHSEIKLPDRFLIQCFKLLDKTDLLSISQVSKHWKSLLCRLWKEKCHSLAKTYGQYEYIYGFIDQNTDWESAYNDLIHKLNRLAVCDNKFSQISNAAQNVQNVQVTCYTVNRDNCKKKIPSNVGNSRKSDILQNCSEQVNKTEFEEFKESAVTGDVMNEPSKAQSDKIKINSISGSSKLFSQISSSSRTQKKQNDITKKKKAFNVIPKMIQPLNETTIEEKDSSTIKSFHGLAEVRIKGIKSLKHVRQLEGHTDAVLCVQFDAKRVITGSMDMSVRLWDIRSGRNFCKLSGHQGGIRCLQFDDMYIVTGSWDTTVMIWDVNNLCHIKTITVHTGCVSCLEMSKDILITGSHDKTVCILQRHTWCLLETLFGHTEPISGLSIVSNEHLLTSSHDKSIILWDIISFKVVRRFYHPVCSLLCVKFCGNLVAAGALNGTIAFWNLLSSSLEGVISAHQGPIHSICFTGERFFTAGGDKFVREWDLATCVCIRSLCGHRGAVYCVRASTQRVVTSAEDGTVRVWELVYKMRQAGGPYDETLISSEMINEHEFKKLLF